MKDYKKQVLAALALVLALGVAMPGAAFADGGTAEGDEAGIETLALDGEEEGDDKTGALGLAASVAELYNRVQNDEGFATYRNFTGLIANTNAINSSDLLKDAAQWAQDTDCYSAHGVAGKVYTWLSSGTRTALSGKKVYQVLTTLQDDEDYTTNTGYKGIVDDLVAANTSLTANEVAQIKVAMPSLQNVDTMDLGAMVSMVEKAANYGKYVALYNSMDFLKLAIDGDEVSADALKSLYTEEDLMKNYNAMAVAAVAIDKDATKGLYAYQLPQAGAPVEEKPEAPATPNTGSVEVSDASALDLALVTMIAAGSLATLGGAALVAKLYLCHKF